MFRLPSLLAFAAASLAAHAAQAHFVWVAVQNDSTGQPQAHVWFSELAEPDDAALIDKIAQTKAWSRAAGKKEGTALALVKEVKDGGGALVGKLPGDAAAVSARCAYGVIERRGMVFRLEYYAKYLDGSSPDLKALAREEQFDLDVVPELSGKECKLVVLWKGKPAAGSEIVAFDATGDQHDLKTDDHGVAKLPLGKPGLYSIRAKWVSEESGKDGDKEYEHANHYCTLALNVPGDKAASAASAVDIVRLARQARAMWDNFPGFEADLKLFAEDRSQQGRIKVSASGEVALSGFELTDDKPILQMLRSLVSHRLGRGADDESVSFMDEQLDHPLGRLIKFDEDVSMGSHYRIQGDVIRQVNRKTDSGRFTISVFQVRRNAEGKYLPGVYSVNFWNADGTLRSNATTCETWIRVGAFDLPLTHDSVTAGKDVHKTVRMEFSQHRLLEKAAAK
ncbi:MAG TPA: DUF3386 family protein [Pirellulaceae bacterium]|nr:DUF3386 family protein [Pirellulaceae bacterium]